MSPFRRDPNSELLLVAAEKLAPVLDRIAFVGGCATGLLVTDPAAAPVRPTIDVDVIVEIVSYAELIVFQDQLRQLGFHQPVSAGAPVCRWGHGGLVVDVMPTDSSILGFSNRWYRPALKSAVRLPLGDHEINLITAPYFLATKLEAFRGRGKNDFATSHDLEDIVTVVDGRSELVAEVQTAQADLRQYLHNEFRALLTQRDFLDALPGHMLADAASQQRIPLLLDRMRNMSLTK